MKNLVLVSFLNKVKADYHPTFHAIRFLILGAQSLAQTLQYIENIGERLYKYFHENFENCYYFIMFYVLRQRLLRL